MRNRFRVGALACALAALAAAPFTAAAQAVASDWPNRPVTLVVPYPPGGTSDVVGRQLAQRLRDQ